MRLLAIVLTVVAIACGGGGARGGQPASTSPPSSTTFVVDTTTSTTMHADTITSGDLGVIVAPDGDGSLPHDLTVGCWAGPVFRFGDLLEIEPLAAADRDAVVEAIEPFLAGEEGSFWPQTDWLILSETGSEILLVHQGADGMSFMSVSRTDDEWQWSGSSSGGPCPLHYQVPEEMNPVDWRLDPKGRELTPDSTEVDVLITERDCVDGREIGDRLLEPEVVMTETTLRVALAARPPPGDAFTCPGNPETPYTVMLPAPLGDREIVEGLAIGLDLEDYLP